MTHTTYTQNTVTPGSEYLCKKNPTYSFLGNRVFEIFEYLHILFIFFEFLHDKNLHNIC